MSRIYTVTGRRCSCFRRIGKASFGCEAIVVDGRKRGEFSIMVELRIDRRSLGLEERGIGYKGYGRSNRRSVLIKIVNGIYWVIGQ